jgi:hypothetical protein
VFDAPEYDDLKITYAHLWAPYLSCTGTDSRFVHVARRAAVRARSHTSSCTEVIELPEATERYHAFHRMQFHVLLDGILSCSALRAPCKGTRFTTFSWRLTHFQSRSLTLRQTIITRCLCTYMCLKILEVCTLDCTWSAIVSYCAN